MEMNTLAEALPWLYSTQLLGIKPGLEVMQELLRRLGNPQCSGRFLHVAGTNGKGSTCAFLESALRVAGYRTGLFTSPHLISFTERIQVAGIPITSNDLLVLLQEMRRISSDMEPHPTFFEITTAMAFRYFQQQQCTVVVLETGLGGRLDATNVVDPLVSVITAIGLDHQAWLGETLAEIAAEKAGIIKRGKPAVFAPQFSEVHEVLERKARAQGCEQKWVREPWPGDLPLGLHGPHQAWNAAVAAEALAASGLEISPAQIARGFATVSWPGRFQEHGRWTLDGAHNADGAEALAAAWRQRHGPAQATLVFAAMTDKNWDSILKALLPLASRVILPQLQTPRAAAAADLAAAISKFSPDLSVELAPDVPAAKLLAEAASARILCAGSLYLCGEVLSLLQSGESFQPSLQ